MPQYLALIYEDEAAYEKADVETMKSVAIAHNEFGEKHGPALRGGNALQPSSAATTLRRDASGELVITSGPFAHAKENLGGYYVFEASDDDHAIAIASQVPARFGGVELRPIRVFD